ncbi:MAG: hypothetical protein ACSI46_01660 [Gloeotrichia echinulata DVL01]|jgi:hypothetical protein|nr:hypothetical protein [Gloeotrichia echinulata DEX184]
MENNQTVQNKSTQPAAISPDLTNGKSRPTSSSKILLQMLARNPWLLLIGLSAIFLAISAFALYSLGSVGYVQQQKEPETVSDIPTLLEESSSTTSESSNPTPLWLIVAIALSCGSGCLIILRLLNHPTQAAKLQKQINYDKVQLVPVRQQRLQARSPKNSAVFAPSSSLSPQTKPMMTVMAPEQTPRLDQSQESLAELMDIRKQNSLPAMLRKY